MKINIIIPEPGHSGGIQMIFHYASYMVEKGHDVIVYYPACGYYTGWKKILFFKSIWRYAKEYKIPGKWYREKNFQIIKPFIISDATIREADIVIATAWQTAYMVNRLKPSKGKKIYFIQDFETWGTDEINEKVKNSYRLPFEERVVVSTALKERILLEIGVDSKVVCNGVEECFLVSSKKNYNKVVIGMPYREERGNDIKNCTLGLEVLAHIKEQYPQVEIITFGFCKPDRWSETILFYENPSREELVELYRKMTIFYVPSVYEGWGLPAMEAMAQGNCVIGADSGVIREIGKDMDNCVILSNARNLEETVNKICELIENVRLVSEIGKKARKIVSQMSEIRSAEKFENILKGLE